MLWAAASGSHGFTGRSAHGVRETERRSTPAIHAHLILPFPLCLEMDTPQWSGRLCVGTVYIFVKHTQPPDLELTQS